MSPRDVVTLSRQIHSFISMFFHEPHKCHGDPLLRSYGTDEKDKSDEKDGKDGTLFVEGHKLEPYYASGVTLLAVERLFNQKIFERNFDNYKYHILMLLKIQMIGQSTPYFNTKKTLEDSSIIVESIEDQESFTERCRKAMDLINSKIEEFDARRPKRGKPPYRTREFTQLLLTDSSPSGSGNRKYISTEESTKRGRGRRRGRRR